MKPETVSLLCHPGTHEFLKLLSVTGPDGRAQEELVGIKTGDKFSVHDGIPVLLDDSKVTGFNKRYQGVYNKVAGLYDGAIRFAASLLGRGEEKFRREYLGELTVKDGDRVLEVSIGTGANLHYLSANVSFYGLDLSLGMLKKCQKNMNRWHKDAELVLGNAEDLPFRDESFDVVFHVGGINAFNDRAKSITEMIRVAKSGTRILIVDETARLMNSVRWFPGIRKWLRDYGERFGAPTGLVPKGMKEVQVKDIAKGNMYCLTFIKP